MIKNEVVNFTSFFVDLHDDVVTIMIKCTDKYQAKVLHEDLMDRFSKGEGVFISTTKG